MKSLIATALVLLTASPLLARPASVNDFYECSYNNGKFNQVLINGLVSPKAITIISSAHNGPIAVAVSDYQESENQSLAEFSGELPPPWAAGTTYKIELRDTMFTSTIRFTGPKMADGRVGRTVSIPMTCR